MSEFAMTVSLILIIFNAGFIATADWHYGEEVRWPHLCKHGKSQSPVALSTYTAEEREFSAFIFEQYEKDYPVHIKNNGHSAEIRLHVREQPIIKGGGLPEMYVLDHLHFHWESEHVIDDYRFPLELHMVHYANHHHNLSEALRHPHGVAVFSVLFDLSPDDDRESEPLIAVIDKLQDKIDTIEKMTFRYAHYIPRDTAGFFRYDGSLTTPGCTEGVLWTVFTNTLRISKTQVKSFKNMKTNGGRALPKNYRSLQDLNERTVFLKVSPIHSTASINRFDRILLFTYFVILYYYQRGF